MTQRQTYDCIIIGGGPSGLMAAMRAAEGGARTVLLESGPKAGRKLLATGGGRCNLTHAGTIESFLKGFETRAARFLKPAAYHLSSDETYRFFESHGVPLKIERGDRVFPQSDCASDVLKALTTAAEQAGAVVRPDSRVTAVERSGEGYLVQTGHDSYQAAVVVIATGGCSMRRSGSTGDGHAFAKSLGHTIVKPHASLVPLVTVEKWPGNIAGLSLRNVTLTARTPQGRIKRFGEMLFTHRGIGGPITLEVSRFLTDLFEAGEGPVPVWIDLKPALDEKKLDARLLREIEDHPLRKVPAMLRTLMPGSLADVFTDHFGFDPALESNRLTREERIRLRTLLKELPLEITGTEPIEEALVTRGGVSTAEINPRTMESRISPGLFFAGEVIDVDGDCGGYNLQMCWSTGWLAGTSAAEKVKKLQSAP